MDARSAYEYHGARIAPVAQLDRVLPSEGRGRGFESRLVRHTAVTRKPQALWVWGFFVGVIFRKSNRLRASMPRAANPHPIQSFLGLTFFSLFRMMAHCLKSQWIVPLGISYAHRDIGNDDVKAFAAVLAGCQTSGEEYQADVFDASQVNTQQEAKTVKILTISPSKIKVSNEKNKKAAMMAGGVLGLIGGAALGNTKNTDTAIVGGVAGGAAGAMAGSLVDDTTLVPGG